MQLKAIPTVLAVGITLAMGVPALADVYTQTTVIHDSIDSTDFSIFFQGGTENNGKTPLYICAAKVGGEYTPGKFYPTNKLCYVSWGGKEYSTNKDVLLFQPLNHWVWNNFPGYIVSNNVGYGTEDDGHTPLYFCRAIVDGEYTPGKYYPPNKTCYVPWGGKEYKFTYPEKNFQVIFEN